MFCKTMTVFINEAGHVKSFHHIPHISSKYPLWVPSAFAWRELSKLVPNGTIVEDTLARNDIPKSPIKINYCLLDAD